jgi:predicted enzyme related to lactoylglutathione lyase
MQLIVNIDVDDLDRAIGFYTAALDLTCERRLFEGSVAELVGASSRIYLLSKSAGSAVSSCTSELRHYVRHWTPVHLDFEVSDIAAAVARAVAAGARLERPVRPFVWGEHAELSDPFGHGFCFVRFTAQGYTAVG